MPATINRQDIVPAFGPRFTGDARPSPDGRSPRREANGGAFDAALSAALEAGRRVPRAPASAPPTAHTWQYGPLIVDGIVLPGAWPRT